LASQIAKVCGATVVLVGTVSDRHRLELAKRLGIDYAVEVEGDQVDRLIRDLTAGEGADVLIECSGAAPAIRQGLLQVRKQAKIIQIGLLGKPLQLDYEQIAYKDLTVHGSFASSASSWERALVLLGRGLVQATPLISDILPLARWEEGFGLVHQAERLKVLLDPTLD
jgi:L-iditol 2-dehydrogenase